MKVNYARIKFNVTGAKRKELVSLISNFTDCAAKYKGAPSFAYEVDYFTIDRNGTLLFDDRADSEAIENLLGHLQAEGFAAEPSESEAEETETTMEENGGARLIIEMPRDTLSDTALQNLTALVTSKAQLIKNALAADSLPIEVTDERVAFDWFGEIEDGETVKAYTQFISALCDMARNQKRVTAKEKPIDNEKYTFRCFLLRLGFIGKEFKAARKILLRNLEGSSAFKSGRKNEVCLND